MSIANIARGKYHIWTVGCQMNQADSQRVATILDGLGWEEVPSMEQANLVILNTCSVRAQPEQRAHGQLSLLGHAKKERSDLLVGMMGCMIGNQKTIDNLKQRYPMVDLFFKVEHADVLPQFLEDRWTPLATGDGCIDIEQVDIERVNPAFATQLGRTRTLTVLPMAAPMRPGEREAHYPTQIAPKKGPTAWLPVVLGCNKVCSYCIVPYRRGRERSRPLAELLTEARHLIDSGAREVTLLGQTVEAYGLDLPDQEADLGDLMAELSEIDGLERIRFMTSYPKHMTDKMIRQMAALPKVCEHVNIPVQSGDDAMLQRMRRGYTLEEYRTLIKKLREWWPEVSLSTDVIVGFCGETPEEFQHTLDLLAEIRFDVVHVAAYSPRPGTLADKWEDDVPLAEKKRRLHLVEELQEGIARELNEPYVGRVEDILLEEQVEQHGVKQWKGRTRTNKLVFFPDAQADSQSALMPGEVVPVRIERASAWSLQGCAVAI
ncbi:MAG TPA: MiaB/RimO family radical SAM methylthiotransferase [Ktedonobacterales bacterium]|nr:MiaB/RimO family radical SAM methylthiotransferase [Ktedonobacterales bacterium]